MISYENQEGEIGLFALKKGYLVYSCAFCRGGVPDFEKGQKYILPKDADPKALGQAILDALNNSRPVSPDDPIFDGRTYMERYNAWFAGVAEDYGVKSKSTFFRDAKSPSCRMNSEQIELRPTVQERVGGFSSFPKTSDKHDIRCYVSRDSSLEEIGRAALEAIALCE